MTDKNKVPEGYQIVHRTVADSIEELYIVFLGRGIPPKIALSDAAEALSYFIDNVNDVITDLRSKFEQVQNEPRH